MMNLRRFSILSQCLLLLGAMPLLHAQTVVTLSTTPNPSRFGAPVVLSATVTPANATGRVTFYDGVTVLGAKPLVSGAASLSTILLPAGTRQLKAYYAGDGSNAAAASNVISQTVNAQPGGGLIPGNSVSGTVLAVADFNGDGKADFAVSGSLGLSILLGDGAGNFQVSSTQNIYVLSAVVGDFNGDGIPDLAYSEGTGPTDLNILLGKGDGTFQPLAGFSLGNPSSVLAVGDFNRDGNADIVVADTNSGAVVFLGKGDGTFQATPLYYPTGPQGRSGADFVLVADFNGDGIADLAAINMGLSVSILLGRGDGTFQPPATISVTRQIVSLAVGDFNGDGKADLVTNNADVLLGKGDGTFQAPVTYAVGSGASSVVVGDFNGDGKPDIALPYGGGLTPSPQGVLSILFGNGDGTFQPPAITAVASPSQVPAVSLLVGEFNGDGITDLAVCCFMSSPNSSQNPNTVMFSGTTKSIIPAAGTPQSTTAATPFPTPLEVTVKDGGNPLSGVTVTFTAPAGSSPLATATLSSGTAVTDANGMASVTATAGSVAGAYTVTATALGVSTGFSLTNVAPVPTNIHGSPATESALVGLPFPSPLVVTVTGASGAPVSGLEIGFTWPISGASAVLSAASAVTDVNGQASVTATANYIPGSYTVTAATLYPLSLSVTFSLTNLQPTTTPVTLVTSSTPSTFGAPVTLTATVSNPGAHARMTFYDGVTPLGTKPASSGTTSFSTLSAGVHKLTAYYRDEANLIVGTSNAVTQTVKAAAGGAFIAQNPLDLAPAGSSVAVGDFNHDGKVDFAFIRVIPGPSEVVTVVLGNGDGTFQAPVNYAIGAAGFAIGAAGATFMVAADFDGDGNTDLVAATTSNGSVNGASTVGILLGNGDGTFRPAANLAAGIFGVTAMAVGDFNGDGKADLLFARAEVSALIGAIRTQLDNPLAIFVNYFGLLEMLPGNGDGTFGTPVTFPILPGNSPTAAGLNPLFVVADFNGDGKPDAVATSGLAGPAVLIGNGDGTVQTPVSINVGGSSVVTLLSGDFNGDGKADLAVGGLSSANVATTTILLGNGDGTFQPPVSYPFGIARTAGDFNGDGFTDFVVTDTSGKTVGILQGKGDGTFQQGVPLSAGGPLAVTEFNGDGKADILTYNAASGTISILLGATPSSGGGTPASLTATGTLQSAQVGAAFPSPLQVTVRDSNGNPVAGATVSFTVPAVGASATLSSATAVTNSLGVASVTATANNIAGSYSVAATLGPLTKFFSLTNLLGGGSNLASGRNATQSSTLPGTSGASVAVDGNTDGAFFDGSVTATNLDNNAWWQVDLGGSAAISSVVVWNRTDCCGSRLGDYWVFVSNTPFLATDTPATLQNRAGTFSSHQTTAPNPSTTIAVNGAQGQYVRVQLSSPNYLSLAEVQVMGTGGAPAPTNLAQGKSATQSSTIAGVASAAASSAVDGNTDGAFYDNSVTATNFDNNAWWQVDLGVSSTISSVTVWNRTDCCSSRLGDYWIFISDTPFLATDTPATLQNRISTFSSHQTSAPNPSANIQAVTQGRYVRVQLTGANNLSLAEVQVFGVAPLLTNLALGKVTNQSSSYPGSAQGSAAAVDNNTDGVYADGSVTATNQDSNAWWQVDLGASATVNSVVVWNRTDCCGSRLGDYWVFVSNTPFLATDTPATLQNRAGTFSSHQTTAPNPFTTIGFNGVQGRYVRVQLSDTDYLSLAEVQVFGTGGAPAATNLALGKSATQSSSIQGYATSGAGSAVDGNQDGNFFDGSVTATNLDTNPWWQVDLGASATVGSVVIFNRTDCCGTRLSDYWVFVSNTPFQATDTPATLQGRAGTFASHQTTAPNPSTTITVGAPGQYVRVQLSSPNYLSLAEVQVFGQ